MPESLDAKSRSLCAAAFLMLGFYRVALALLQNDKIVRGEAPLFRLSSVASLRAFFRLIRLDVP